MTLSRDPCDELFDGQGDLSLPGYPDIGQRNPTQASEGIFIFFYMRENLLVFTMSGTDMKNLSRRLLC